MAHRCILLDLGRCEYQKVLALQLYLAGLKAAGEFEDSFLLLVEHNPVITAGRAIGAAKNLRVSVSELEKYGIDLVYTGRGGDLTYHGPGQLVGYPLLDLKKFYCADPLHYLRSLESILIKSLRAMGHDAVRLPGFTGVWVNEKKVAAIGIQVKQGITLHGFALNVNVDLNHFKLIYPCGIKDREVTSIEKLAGKHIPLHQVKSKVIEYFAADTGLQIAVDHAVKEEMLRLCPVNLTG